MAKYTENQNRIWLEQIRRKTDRQVLCEIIERLETLENEKKSQKVTPNVTTPTQKVAKATKKTLDTQQ